MRIRRMTYSRSHRLPNKGEMERLEVTAELESHEYEEEVFERLKKFVKDQLHVDRLRTSIGDQLKSKASEPIIEA